MSKFSQNSLLLLVLITIGCSHNTENRTVKRYEIEFDGFKAEFYEKYDMWLIIDEETNVKTLTQLIDSTNIKARCNNIRPVMWKINVHAIYDNDENHRILTLASSTSKKEALNIGRTCYEANELIKTLKILTNIERIKNFPGKMRQQEYDKIKLKG